MNDNFVYLVCTSNYEFETILYCFDDEKDARTYVAENSDENDYWLDLKMYVKKVPKYSKRG